MNVREIQTALNSFGFNPGEIDGIWGRRTIMAVKAFQKACNLTPDGVVGPLTLRALSGNVGATASTFAEGESGPLVWYEAAAGLVGTREDTSDRSNPTLIKWAEDLNIDYKSDDIPWCGLFVAHCIGSTLPDEHLPGNPLRARNWERFGEKCEPKRGAVLVFWRGKPNGGQGHVGFYHSEDEKTFHVLGGNQSDSVNIARIQKSRLLASRWPRTAATLTGAVVMAQAQGPISHNEA